MHGHVDSWQITKATKQGTILSDESFHITIKEAYAIQDKMVKLKLQKGETISGYKVGCTGDQDLHWIGSPLIWQSMI